MARDPEVVVVGGGILGLLIATLAVKRYRTELWRMPDDVIPQADTLRNMAWLHSGLAYYVRGDKRDLARRLKAAGSMLLNEFGMRPSGPPGIFRVADDYMELFSEAVEALELGRSGEAPEVVRNPEQHVGELARGATCFWVPDRPFPEADLLFRLRRRAQAAGVIIQQHRDPVRIEHVSGEVPRVHLPTGGIRRPLHTVLATGAHLPAMVRQAGLHAYGTPLLRRVGAPWLHGTRLFHDFRRPRPGVAILQHPGLAPEAPVCELIGARICKPVEDPQRRRTCPKHIEDTINLLPPGLAKRLRDGSDPYKVTAAYKVGATKRNPPECPNEDYWVRSFGPHLIAAFPGRATLAYPAAERVLDLIEEAGDLPGSAAIPDDADGLSEVGVPAEVWVGRILMHYHYPSLDERDEDVLV